MRPSRRAAGRSACSRPGEATGLLMREIIQIQWAVIQTARRNVQKIYELDLNHDFLARPIPKVLQRPSNDNAGERFAFAKPSRSESSLVLPDFVQKCHHWPARQNHTITEREMPGCNLVNYWRSLGQQDTTQRLLFALAVHGDAHHAFHVYPAGKLRRITAILA